MNIVRPVYDKFYIEFKQYLSKMDRSKDINIELESDRILKFLSDCLIENLTDYENLTKVDKKIISDIINILTNDLEKIKLLNITIKLKLCKTKEEWKRLLKECEFYEYYDMCSLIREKIRKIN